MEAGSNIFFIDTFLAVTFGIIALLIGRRINQTTHFLQQLSIPEPVTGGLLFALLFALLYSTTGIEIKFDLTARDFLLVYFFTTIGINASFKDIIRGGRPLLILLAITIVYMFLQNLLGVSLASLFNKPGSLGLLSGTVSLIGGYGTAIAWAPKFMATQGIANAMEIAIACATFGLISASIMGGPLARLLIKRYKLTPIKNDTLDMALQPPQPTKTINAVDVMDSIIAIHVCIAIGYCLNLGLINMGVELPLFVTCLLAGILITNLLPARWPRLSGQKWPCRTPVMALIAELSLGTFLAMSLMSLQLFRVLELAGPIFIILVAQVLLTLFISLFIIFPAMGRNYDAAIICCGFVGFSLGSVPTAIANMSSVTQRYGASHLAFIVVPILCAFFIDFANALIIPLFANYF